MILDDVRPAKVRASRGQSLGSFSVLLCESHWKGLGTSESLRPGFEFLSSCLPGCELGPDMAVLCPLKTLMVLDRRDCEGYSLVMVTF